MRSLGILVLILAVAVGCKKAKPTHADTDPPPAAQAERIRVAVAALATSASSHRQSRRGIVANPGAMPAEAVAAGRFRPSARPRGGRRR